ncbi:unnamed protein product [Calicophoron daubneyi]|uniref:Malic enzyme n=1 Tax=Calicophoron daubneyi TaxID=300641 RepID=A0AAV2TK85_CALDB
MELRVQLLRRASKLSRPIFFRCVSSDTLHDLTRRHGIDALRDPATNKGTSFSLRERQLLGIHGLLPPAVLTMEQQVQKVMRGLERTNDELHKYALLSDLQERNERLFYKLLISHTAYCMPIIYTPTVGLACMFYGAIYRRPRGVYITIHDREHIIQILNNWPTESVKAIVVTDGERILGLGDLGANGMGIPVGKLALYSALAGVHPSSCLPVVLDVGTNNQELLDDPLYTGVRHRRVADERYDDLIKKFLEAVVAKYGWECLIQLEDFATRNAFRLLEQYGKTHCIFDDDIQGTASVTLAGLLAATRITKRPLKENVYVFVGAGEAAVGIGRLLIRSLRDEGLTKDEARRLIYMFDKDGLLTEGRPDKGITPQNKLFARTDTEPTKDLEKIVREKKATTIIGVSGVGGLFTPGVLKQMAANVDRPIVFALSNPTSNSECTAEQAYRCTDGRCVFASGSPFDSVEVNVGGQTKRFHPGQCNNSYIFPGIGLAITSCRIRPVAEVLFQRAAQVLAEQVSSVDLEQGRLYPSLGLIREVSLKIAAKVSELAYEKNYAQLYPKPTDLRHYILGQMYSPDYVPEVPETYEWPKEAFGVAV